MKLEKKISRREMLKAMGVGAAGLYLGGKAPAVIHAAEEVSLSIWGGYPEMEPFYAKVAEAYREKNPNVTIDILTHPLREFEQKLSATIPADTAADLIEISVYAMQKFIEAELIPPLPDDVRGFVTGEDHYSSFLVNNNTYQEQIYGLPLFMGRTCLFWNKTMFAEEGLDRAPETFEEMREYAKKLARYDEAGNLTRSGHSLRLSGAGSGVAEKWWFVLYPAGGSILEKVDDKYRAGYNNEAGRMALQYYIDMVYKDHSDDHKIKHDAESFALELTAMFFRESWVIGNMKKLAPEVEYATAPVPKWSRWGRITNGVNLYVTQTSQNPDVAWDFAMFMQEPDNMRTLLDEVGWLPCRQDVDYEPVLEKAPQFRWFLFTDPEYEEYGYFSIAPFDEIMTKLAERLVAAYLDPSLVDNPDGIAKFIEDAANETNEILKEAELYAEE